MPLAPPNPTTVHTPQPTPVSTITPSSIGSAFSSETNPATPYQAFYDSIRSVYALTASPVSAVFEQYYHPTDATFEDPLVKVTNTADVIGQFRALKALFSEAAVETHSVTVSEHHMVIDWTVTYVVRGTFGLLSFKMPTITSLTLTEDGSRVLTHVDHWSVHELLSNVPIVSFIYNAWKPLMGKTSSVLTNVLHHYLVAGGEEKGTTTGRVEGGPERERAAGLVGSD